MLYYRLKQTDYDGQFEYSEIISIRKNSAYDYQPSIYPNPFNENTSLILSKNLINGSITISTTNGVVVYQKNNISGNTISITKDNLANGLYFVSLKENDELIYQSKLVASD